MDVVIVLVIVSLFASLACSAGVIGTRPWSRAIQGTAWVTVGTWFCVIWYWHDGSPYEGIDLPMRWSDTLAFLTCLVWAGCLLGLLARHQWLPWRGLLGAVAGAWMGHLQPEWCNQSVMLAGAVCGFYRDRDGRLPAFLALLLVLVSSPCGLRATAATVGLVLVFSIRRVGPSNLRSGPAHCDTPWLTELSPSDHLPLWRDMPG